MSDSERGQFAHLLRAARTELQPFVAGDGSVTFAAPAILAVVARPR
jgi:hypothetical protein